MPRGSGRRLGPTSSRSPDCRRAPLDFPLPDRRGPSRRARPPADPRAELELEGTIDSGHPWRSDERRDAPRRRRHLSPLAQRSTWLWRPSGSRRRCSTLPAARWWRRGADRPHRSRPRPGVGSQQDREADAPCCQSPRPRRRNSWRACCSTQRTGCVSWPRPRGGGPWLTTSRTKRRRGRQRCRASACALLPVWAHATPFQHDPPAREKCISRMAQSPLFGRSKEAVRSGMFELYGV